jgi:hypothetical protein
MTLYDPFQVRTIQQVSLLHADAIPKRLQPLRRANQRCDRMTAFKRLPNDLQPGGTQYNQLHKPSLSGTLCAPAPAVAFFFVMDIDDSS